MLNPTNQARSNFPEFNSPGFLGVPFAGSTPENHSFYPVQAKTTDSGLTYHVNIPASRKRSRDSAADQIYAVQNFPAAEKHSTGVSRHAGEDNNNIYNMQFEIDSIISQHTKKMRLELEERRERHARILVAALGEGVTKKLREKDDQIQRVGRLNLALQDRVKSIYEENQLWRELAQSNEATVNSLRANLEQVLSHVGGGGVERAAAEEEDVESCCGSCSNDDNDIEPSSGSGDKKCCKMCGEREPCVLLLPCRHLCLCGVCGSGSRQLQACPVCNTSMNATLHVNMSS